VQGGEDRGGKINILNGKKKHLPSTNFNLLSQIDENSVHHYDYFRFIIPVRGGHYDSSPLRQKS
jgi:hypothetical protein